MMRSKILIFVLLFFVLFESGCSTKEKIYKKTALLMGTFVEIQIVPEKRATKTYLDSVIKSAFSDIRAVENIFSLYNSNSELSRLNELGVGHPYRVSEEFMFLLKKANFFHQLTEGAFDISIASLEDVWLEASRQNEIPGDGQIRDALNVVGTDKIITEEIAYTVELPEGMKLDFGAIAKGYAADRAIRVLKKEGIKNAIVNAGGDIYCLGKGPGKIGWQIGVKHPRKKDAFIATLVVADKAVATSGDYERFHVIKDEKFSYIFNPATGMPVDEAPMSVTVLAEDCLTADALATAIFVLGPNKGMQLLDRLNEAEGVIISKGKGELDIKVSKGLKEIDIFGAE